MSETPGKCGVPVHSSIDIQVTTYGLLVVHVDLVSELYLPIYCQVAPPTEYCPKRESVRDGQSTWAVCKTRKLGRLSIYWTLSPTR
jgi:hypothetical protein